MNFNETLALSSTIVRSCEQVSGSIDGEAVLLRLEDGSYFSINAMGTRIWDSIALPTRVSTLVEQLHTRYAVDRLTCEAEVFAFLGRLQGARLMSVLAQ